ncbi:probable chitinase 10 [Sabethes cyaneus]|uniref:probable chitinase 10 n=1 Tax=Sabethes cyaneus TaxID=53552 RepID=UPI00237E8E6E|nr:probable chitinase 10 [Sabethes cyaneus]
MHQYFFLLLFFLCHSESKTCIEGETCPQEEQCDLDIRCPRFDDGDSAVLIPHHDCTKFYKCASGRTCQYRCPSNLHFNPVELACDWPEKACCDPSLPCTREGCIQGLTCNRGFESIPSNQSNPIKPPTYNNNNSNNIQTRNQSVAYSTDGSFCIDHIQCPSNDIPNNPALLPHTNCQQFYKCSNGKACLLSCPTGLHFSRKSNSCEYPNVACCDSSVPCTGVVHHVSTNCQADSRCSLHEDPMNPTHLRHTDCRLFYKCSYGKACELSCPVGQHFSQADNRCEFPSVACCDRTLQCYRGNNAASSQSTSVSSPAPEIWTDPRNATECKLDTRCSSSNEKRNIYFRHANCSKYYQCNSGYACEFQCPPGLHFNERDKVCQWPQNAACDMLA